MLVFCLEISVQDDFCFSGFNSSFLCLQTNGTWQEQNTPPSATSPGSDHSDNSDWWAPSAGVPLRYRTTHGMTKEWWSLFYPNAVLVFHINFVFRSSLSDLTLSLIHETWADFPCKPFIKLFLWQLSYSNQYSNLRKNGPHSWSMK